MKAIIIDDEKNSREALRKKVISYCPEITIAAEGGDGEEGLKLISEYDPEIVFLDIEMPRMNGFNMLQQLPQQNFHLVFTTAYDQYAIDAIRYSAFDYLVKPVDTKELKQCVSRIVEKEKRQQPTNPQQVELLLQQLLKEKNAPKKIAISTVQGIELIALDEVVYLEAVSNYTNIHLSESKPILTSKTLKEYEDLLPATQFFRVHNGAIININFIKKFIKGEGGQLQMSNGILIDVARRRKEELLQLLQMLALKA